MAVQTSNVYDILCNFPIGSSVHGIKPWHYFQGHLLGNVTPHGKCSVIGEATSKLFERDGNCHFSDCHLSKLQCKFHPHVLTNSNSPRIQPSWWRDQQHKENPMLGLTQDEALWTPTQNNWHHFNHLLIFSKTKNNSALYTINFLSPSQGQCFGSWFSSWCSRGITGEVHKSQKYIMLFPKRNIRNQKLKETLGLFCHFSGRGCKRHLPFQ